MKISALFVTCIIIKDLHGNVKEYFPLYAEKGMKDRILQSRFVKKFTSSKLYSRLAGNRLFSRLINYETISYVLCGAATTAVNYAVYFLVRVFFREDYGILIAQLISWIAAVIFAYVVNKVFVFDSPGWDRKTLVREFIPFLTARILSFGFDTAFVYITAGILHWNEPLMKVLSSIFVLIANYFASKFIVFKKKTPEEQQP